MSRVIILDTGPLGLLTNPRKTPEVIAATLWAISVMAAGHRLIVPAIADFEVRRELERARKTRSVAALDAFNTARPDRFLSVTDSALRLAATLWAQARNLGTPGADPKELDADVIIAAQALDMGVPTPDLIIATTNVGHLSRFLRAELWTNIAP
jgi:predicted nucleic acid-binding protein